MPRSLSPSTITTTTGPPSSTRRMLKTKYGADSDDPLTRAMAPPPDETPAQREERVRAEQEAKRVSDLIDEELNRQRQAEKKAPRPVKILLLGQSESGKSTTLKNFQLMDSPKCFRAERASWRAVIQLNVVRSMRVILDAMSDVHSQSRTTTPTPAPPSIYAPARTASPSPLSPAHLQLKMRLAPLTQVEAALVRRLGPLHLASLTNLPQDGGGAGAREPCVNGGSAWKGAFGRLLTSARGSFETGSEEEDWKGREEAGLVLSACCEDMIRLWEDPEIQALLEAKGIRLEEKAGFFLDSLERVTQPKYMPTDDDILRARIKTLGVSEYRFTPNAGNAMPRDWRIFDVGGQRSFRAAWAPFFDDMDAIIFLAPISCFDQVLEEDPTVNRLEDSVLLWQHICAHPLLARTNLVLFLNKTDILRAKLRAGVRFADHVHTFGGRPNDYESVSAYLRKHFAAIHKQHSNKERPFYCHFTTVTDTKSTTLVLKNVQDIVIRQNLRNINLIE